MQAATVIKNCKQVDDFTETSIGKDACSPIHYCISVTVFCYFISQVDGTLSIADSIEALKSPHARKTLPYYKNSTRECTPQKGGLKNCLSQQGNTQKGRCLKRQTYLAIEAEHLSNILQKDSEIVILYNNLTPTTNLSIR